jgi:DNA-binding XRE family transcriptional regulator
MERNDNGREPRGTHGDILLAVQMRRVREACGLTRAQAAEALGWKRARITQIESGLEPTLNESVALARLYAIEGLRLLDEYEASAKVGSPNAPTSHAARNGSRAAGELTALTGLLRVK